MSNPFGGGRGTKIHKTGIAMGVTFGGDPAKSDKNTNFLVVMCVRL